MKTYAFSLASATDTVVFDNLFTMLRYDEGSGTGTPLIRIKALSGGSFDVEMKPGKVLQLPNMERGFVITNLTAAAITGKLTIGAGNITDNNLSGTVTLDAAALAALESVDLNPATLAALESVSINPRVYGTSFVSVANMVANTAVQVFSAAANVNGAIVHFASFSGGAAALCAGSILAKSGAAPTTISDGDLVGCTRAFYSAASNPTSFLEVAENISIPAGKGLFMIANAATVGKLGANYTLL